ncbi:unnamed protein product [Parnassius mnemosyne]|uniref:Uncharacterized protein n=1 Tax=Parnassius mnemosyne TaxID=213953 RepID=A0AAV1MCF6_9NEOP
MFRVVAIFILFIYVNGASIPPESQAETVAYQNTNDGTGNYFFSYLTSNGITRQESGHLVNAGQPDEHVDVEGFYSYTDSDGVLQNIYYTADANGYAIRTKPSYVNSDNFFSTSKCRRIIAWKMIDATHQKGSKMPRNTKVLVIVKTSEPLKKFAI